jgi:signal transduction histidine kinase
MSNEMQKFYFSVDSSLLGELGEKLVSTVHVALTELVKNSYDADASLVNIQILPEKTGGSRVIIEDNGSGMTIDQVRAYWMKIGTTHKADEPVSKRYGRLRTGSKGIGRFACRRLGLNLLLKTTSQVIDDDLIESEFQSTEITFEWAKFEPGIDVEHVECDGLTTTSSIGKLGTRLEIWGGSVDEWSLGGLRYLKRQLAILASNTGARRKGYEEDPGFNIKLSAPGFNEEVLDLREEIIDATWGTLIAEVDDSGRAICSLNAKGLGGTKVFTSEARFQAVKGASMRVGIMPLQNKNDARKPNILSKYAIQEISQEWGGVQVRFNGFRMFPYGDTRDDWLEIDADRGRRLAKPGDADLFRFASAQIGVDPSRALLNMLSMKSYFGYVNVTSEIPNLSPKIDRQGFIENEAFSSLRTFARFCIDWANIYRDYYVQLRQEQEAESARLDLEPILKEPISKEILVPKAVNYLRSEVTRLVESLPQKQKEVTESAISRTIDAIELRSQANQRQLEHLRLVASASTLTLLFAHEIRTLIGSLGASQKRLNQIAEKVEEKERRDLNEIADQLAQSKTRFDSLVDMTGIVGAFSKQANLEKLHLKHAIEKACKCFDMIIESYDIKIDYSKVFGNIVVGPMIEGELYAVLINLLSNSIKSVIAAAPDQKNITFEGRMLGGKVELKILDNGIGLDEQFFTDVFTPFISDPSGVLYDKLEERANPQDAHLFGTGSGLGLSIVKDILAARKGDIKFISPPAEWSTCAEVILP